MWEWIKSKLPVSRSNHEKALAETEAKCNQQMAMQNRTAFNERERLKKDYDQSLKEMSADLERVLPKLVALTVEPPRAPFRNFALRVELNERMVMDSFSQGNDNYMIKHVCHHVASMLEREFKSINIARYLGQPVSLTGSMENAKGRTVGYPSLPQDFDPYKV
jgi:hypothetical protein